MLHKKFSKNFFLSCAILKMDFTDIKRSRGRPRKEDDPEKQAQREKTREYYYANRDDILRKAKERYIPVVKEKILTADKKAYMREYYQREDVKRKNCEASKQWYYAHREQIIAKRKAVALKAQQADMLAQQVEMLMHKVAQLA